MLEIRHMTVAEIQAASNFETMLEQYAVECAVYGLPHPKAKLDAYKAAEAAGFLKIIAAYIEDQLVGFITIMTCVLPHYSEHISVTESYFVMLAHRTSGAGLKLLHAAEEHAREVKSRGLLVSAGAGSRLAQVLEKTDYKETHTVYFKGFTCET